MIEPGRWTLQGNWLAREVAPAPVKGKILVAWNRDHWFTMVTKLTFPGSELADQVLQHRGRVTSQERQYTFMMQHNLLGTVEGEGWIAPDSIVQRYWVLSDRQQRTGFETLYRLTADQYHLSSGVMAGYYLVSTMEAVLARHDHPV
nr:hypothetical protein [Romeria gracilis]